MAIEIKRTPVLEGDAAQAFLTSVQKSADKKAPEQKVRIAMEKSKKILAAFKSR